MTKGRRWLLGLAVVAPRVAVAQSAAEATRLAQAIPVQAGAVIDRDSVTIGDVVRLTVRVHAPYGATISFPTLLDSLGPVQSIEPPIVRDGADTARAADRVAVYRVAPWNVGRLAIKLGDVLVQTDEGERHIELSLPSLFVRSVLPADTALRTPKPARPLIQPRRPIPWWWWLAAAVAALAIGVGAWWWNRRTRTRGQPRRDPFAEAEAEFTRIERLGLLQAGEVGRHAALMADVLRRYLAEQVNGASLALTSTELVAAIRGSSTLSPERLEKLFGIIDSIKFAAAPVGASAARGLGDEARAIVRDERVESNRLAATADRLAATREVAA